MRRIFLVGCPRSGTTLVQSLLAAAPGMVAFTESHFFDKCFSSPGNPLRPVRVDQTLARDTLARFCAENDLDAGGLPDSAWRSPDALAAGFVGLLDGHAAAHGAGGWIEKTPDHLRRLSLLRAAAPDAEIVHVLRNPAETISSLCKASRDWGKPRSWLAFAVKWAVSIDLSSRFVGKPGHVHVFYEDVINDSREASQRLYTALALAWDEGVLQRYLQTAESVVAPHETWKRNNLKEIGPKSDDQVGHNRAQSALLSWLDSRYRNLKTDARHAQQ